jgi:hypothetical protein
MNERIIELVEKADKNHQLALVPAEIVEKFAKLIVLECADLIHKKVGAKSALDILDHFGLE